MEVDDVLSLASDQIGDLRSPVMLVALSGFFDIASAATAALERLGDPEQSVTIGEIDPDPFYDFTQARPVVTVEAGERRIHWPNNRIDLVRTEQRDLIVTTGTEPHLHWRTYTDCLITTTARLGCEFVITVGAFADAVPHTRPPLVAASTTDQRLSSRLGIGGPTYQGPTGIAGVLQVALAESSIPGISVRVGIPHYLMNTEQPAAIASLHQHLNGILGLGPTIVGDEELAEIHLARQLHDELVRNDEQLAGYVAELERHFDVETEVTLPTADEIGAQIEAFLDEVDESADGANRDQPSKEQIDGSGDGDNGRGDGDGDGGSDSDGNRPGSPAD